MADQVAMDVPLLPRANSQRSDQFQGVIFTTGFALFVLGDAISAYGYVIDPSGSSTKADPGYWTDTAWALLNTVGLLVMTVADLDVNHYLGQNRIRLVLTMLVWLVSYLALVFASKFGKPYLIPCIPIVYLALRFDPIADQEKGFPLLTELFAAVLSFDLVGNGGTFLMAAAIVHAPYWVAVVVFLLLGPVCVLFAHRWSQRKHETPTLCFGTVAFAYLFILGIGYLLVGMEAALHHDSLGVGVWFVALIHLLPTIAMLIFRQQIQQVLGRCWLRRRGSLPHGSDEEGLEHIAGLHAIEEAINLKRDLNAYVRTSGDDSCALLHLACMGNQLDSVQRLLIHGGVQIDQGTKIQGQTPIFLASMLGHAHCVEMLLEYGADPVSCCT
jgi:hypothetical protein